MKKIFTLLFSILMLSTAFAQYGQRDRTKENDVYVFNDSRGYDKHDKDFRGNYVFTLRERDMQIAQINREYGYKIQSVKNKTFMSWHQKKRAINNLELQRDNEINAVMYKFNDRRNQFGDGYKRDNKRW